MDFSWPGENRCIQRSANLVFLLMNRLGAFRGLGRFNVSFRLTGSGFGTCCKGLGLGLCSRLRCRGFQSYCEGVEGQSYGEGVEGLF